MKSTTKTSRTPAPAVRGRKTLGAIAGALALLCAAPAFADPITFETIAPIGYAAGETVTENGFDILMVDGPYGGANGVVMDDGTCAVAACPAGATGQYLGILNDGAVRFSLTDTARWGFKLGGFDFAFIAPVGDLPNGNYGRLQLSGTVAGGGTLSTSLAFPGQNALGQFRFSGASLDDVFRSVLFTSLTVNACIFDDNLVCSNSVDSPAFYQAQFALDNVDLSAVPEPASFLLLGLGMGALALGRRRAAKSTPSNNLQVQGI